MEAVPLCNGGTDVPLPGHGVSQPHAPVLLVPEKLATIIGNYLSGVLIIRDSLKWESLNVRNVCTWSPWSAIPCTLIK